MKSMFVVEEFSSVKSGAPAAGLCLVSLFAQESVAKQNRSKE